MRRGTRAVLIMNMVALFVTVALLAKDLCLPSAQTLSATDSFGVVKLPVAKKAPSVCLKTLQGKPVVLDDFRGTPVLVNFWASWCPSCIDEIPMMEQFAEGKKDQVVILKVAIDGEKEKKIGRLVREKKITLPVLLDAKAKTARAFGVTMIPTSFLIDREGLIVGMIVGERDWVSPKAWSAIKEVFDLR